LAARVGASGLPGLGRLVPFVGGLVGGGFDALVTRGIGTAAKMTFRAGPADVTSSNSVALTDGTPPDADTAGV
jgi:hypothetical protein